MSAPARLQPLNLVQASEDRQRQFVGLVFSGQQFVRLQQHFEPPRWKLIKLSLHLDLILTSKKTSFSYDSFSDLFDISLINCEET